MMLLFILPALLFIRLLLLPLLFGSCVGLSISFRLLPWLGCGVGTDGLQFHSVISTHFLDNFSHVR
jgi:hypothetical protein